MRKLVLASLAAAIAAPLMAQVAPTAPMAPMTQQGGKSITRAEFIQRAVAAFQRADTNHDGVVTADELAALQAQGGGGWKQSPDGGQWKRSEGPMANPNAAFDRLDTNHDGVLSRQEFAAGREVRIEQRRVMMQNGQGQAGAQPMAGDMQAMHGMHRGGGMGGAGMLRMADLNHDGRITLQEVQTVAAQHFDMMDTNHDGVLTPDERKANRGHMMPMDMKRGN
jgi:hypothetical protein